VTPCGNIPVVPRPFSAAAESRGPLANMRVIELHSPVKVVQRSKGRTATAAAAYRSGTRIECERTGEVHDYTRKKGIEQTALLVSADAPEWALDRAKLWNAAEQREKHPRAQTAREVEIAFPAEFNAAQRRAAGLAIGNLIVERYGAAADLCWHKPSRKGDERNHHLHVLFTTRRFENGDWAKTKDRTLDDLYGKGAEEITSLREGIAGVLNDIAARDRLNVYIEHLSYEKRGLDLEATQHMGPVATQMERRGKRTDIGDKNREIETRNDERRKLHEQRKVVNLEMERERLQPPRTALALPHEFSAFYQDVQARRRALLSELEEKHGQQEKEAKQELGKLYTAAEKNIGIIGLWRKVTGQTKRENEQIKIWRNSLEAIQKQKQEAFAAFERDRQARLEVLKQSQHQAAPDIPKTPANDDRLERARRLNESLKARQRSRTRQPDRDLER